MFHVSFQLSMHIQAVCSSTIPCKCLAYTITRRIARAFARLVLKIQNLHIVVSLLKDYTIFFTIDHPVIVNYVLLLIKTIQLLSTYNNNLIC